MFKQISSRAESVAILTLAVVSAVSQAQTSRNNDFVNRQGSKLTLAGLPFRYSGPNLEWRGLEGYGPFSKSDPRFPTHCEIDDAFATAAGMGAKVVRSQTMGDSVGRHATSLRASDARMFFTAIEKQIREVLHVV